MSDDKNKLSTGYKLPLFGLETKRHAMRNKDANLLVHALNAFLNLSIVRGNYSKDELVLSANNAILKLMGTPGNVAALLRVRLVSVQANYCTCVRYDGSFEGETLYIAKPFKLRNSITTETIDSNVITYSYTSTTEREATNTTPDPDEVETQVVTPYYLEDDELFCGAVNSGVVGPDSEPLKYIDLNLDARAWTAVDA